MDKLTLLNERRVSLGKPALKSWRGSKAKLEEAIALLGHALPEAAKAPKEVKAKAKPIAKAITKGEHTALPQIARELGIDPKKARAMLRKAHGAAWKALPEAEIRTLIIAQ